MKKVKTDLGFHYEMDWDNIPTEDLDTIFEGNVLEALYFIIHNKIKLEHRDNIAGPWKDEWDDGKGLAYFMRFAVSKRFHGKEPARLENYLRWWRFKQPTPQDKRKLITW